MFLRSIYWKLLGESSSSMVRTSKLRKALLIVAIFVLLPLLTACGIQIPIKEPPPASTGNVPLYPHASNMNLINKTKQSSFPWKLVTFQTKDTPSDVWSFYTDVLLKDGWDTRTGSVPLDDQLTFYWGRNSDVPFTWMFITARRNTSGLTDVTIELHGEPGL